MSIFSVTAPPKKNITIPENFATRGQMLRFMTTHSSDLFEEPLTEFGPVADDEVPVAVLRDMIRCKSAPVSSFTNI